MLDNQTATFPPYAKSFSLSRVKVGFFSSIICLGKRQMETELSKVINVPFLMTTP